MYGSDISSYYDYFDDDPNEIIQAARIRQRPIELPDMEAHRNPLSDPLRGAGLLASIASKAHPIALAANVIGEIVNLVSARRQKKKMEEARRREEERQRKIQALDFVNSLSRSFESAGYKGGGY